MSRIALLLVCAGMLPVAPGCKHMAEKQAITHFMAAIENDDLQGLRTLSSSQFEHKALRLDTSLEEMKRLRLPSGEFTILEVKDESETEKLVTVEFGDAKRKLFYRLVHNPETKKWAVDDLYVRQRQDGLKVDKAVTEQMDLLLTVREFHDAWESRERERILSVTAPELRQALSELPEDGLLQITQKVLGESQKDPQMRPPQFDNDVAVVTLTRPAGKVIATFKLLEDGWRLNDLAVESRKDGDHIPSLQKMASAMHSALNFLDAYAQHDKATLKDLCGSRFYTGSLGPGDLSLVPLPGSALPADSYQLKMQGGRADLIIDHGEETVMVSLERPAASDPDSLGTPLKYLVTEVTVFAPVAGRARPGEKRLSALFTGRAVAEIYAEALAARDLSTLSKISTTDFQNRAWGKFSESGIAELVVLDFERGPLQVLAEEFYGAVTELTVQQGPQTLTYRLRDCDGEIRVDDVLVAAADRPQSLKETLEVLAPVHTFAAALAKSELGIVQRHSSSEFNRLVWRQLQEVPELGQAAARYLHAPLAAIKPIDQRSTLVLLGDERFGAKVLLVEEHQQRVVDEILLVAGPSDEQQARLKGTLRNQIATGQLASGIQPVAHEMPATEPPAGNWSAEPAVYESYEEDAAVTRPLEPSDSAFLPPPDEGGWSDSP